MRREQEDKRGMEGEKKKRRERESEMVVGKGGLKC